MSEEWDDFEAHCVNRADDFLLGDELTKEEMRDICTLLIKWGREYVWWSSESK